MTQSNVFPDHGQAQTTPPVFSLSRRRLFAVAATVSAATALLFAAFGTSLFGGLSDKVAGSSDGAGALIAPTGPTSGTTSDRSEYSLSLSYGDDAEGFGESAKGGSAIAPSSAPSPDVQTGVQSLLETAGRSIISTSSLSIEVDDVNGAMSQLRAIANGAGGFIETLSTAGGSDPARGNATIRVPGTAFLSTLELVKGIGEVVGESVGSDDVTEQVIDLQARLRSEQAKEVSFLELLDRADTVSDLLSIERELARVRTEIERLTGQLSFIEQRVNLATIHVSLGQPESLAAQPPSASLAVELKDVEEAVALFKTMVEQAGGEVDSTSISLNNGVLQAFVAARVAPADFDDTLFRAGQLGKVTAKEIREPGATSALPESEEATAKLSVAFNEPVGGRNWWVWGGVPAGALAAVLLLVGVYRIGAVRNRA